MTVALFGTGPMAAEYCRVLDFLEVDYVVLGNTIKSCLKFQNLYDVEAIANGIEYFFANESTFTSIIIAIPVEKQFHLTKKLLTIGHKRILIEKPGFLHDYEFEEIAKLSAKQHVEIYFAYNRRYYSTVESLKNLVEHDGGISSCYFEFTELTDRISELNKPAEVLENWLLCNSTHVIDLFLNLCGAPEDWTSHTNGITAWGTPAVYVGSGRTTKNISFAYTANWESAGSWRIELSTKAAKYILAPLESLRAQQRNTFVISNVATDDKFDLQFKAGLLKMVKCFIARDNSNLCTLTDQIKNLEFYRAISK